MSKIEFRLHWCRVFFEADWGNASSSIRAWYSDGSGDAVGSGEIQAFNVGACRHAPRAALKKYFSDMSHDDINHSACSRSNCDCDGQCICECDCAGLSADEADEVEADEAEAT